MECLSIIVSTQSVNRLPQKLHLLLIVKNLKNYSKYREWTVLEHHQRPEVEDHQSVNTQLPTVEDGVGLLWNIRYHATLSSTVSSFAISSSSIWSFTNLAIDHLVLLWHSPFSN